MVVDTVDVQNLFDRSTTQNTTNDKNFPKNFNLLIFMIKERITRENN